ncbi:MAG: ATP-grasp domain-containing protein [Methylomonas sp.]
MAPIHTYISEPAGSFSRIPQQLLVIAQSARMLAQMAVDAGFTPIAIDCFADSDTRQLALDAAKVSSLRFGDVQDVLERMRDKYGLTHVVYGSGFEAYTETLVCLENDWVVLGNSAGVFTQFQDKPAFFSRLAQLSIPYPETVFSRPKGDDIWLAKPMRGEGGVGIRFYDPTSTADSGGCYWQRFLDGEALSVSFVAYRNKIKVLGFNRQWTAAIADGEQPFLFAGIANHADVSSEHRLQVCEWLDKLAKIYALRGLGSLDFVVSNGCCYVLEINARIPASAQLYGAGVFAQHVRACLGYVDNTVVERAPPAAYQIVYTQKNIQISGEVSWPEWVRDRPDGGAIIGKGQPICSIIAAGKKPGQVFKLLRHRQQVIEKLLNTGS